MTTEPLTLDSEGAARLLHCSQAMACELAAKGMVPATMIAGQWLFVTEQLIDHLKQMALEGQAQRREAAKVVEMMVSSGTDQEKPAEPRRPGRRRRAPVDLSQLATISDKATGP